MQQHEAMVPDRNLLLRPHDSHGCCFSPLSPKRPSSMADKDSRTDGNEEEDEEEGEAGTSSRDPGGDGDWLQLSIGGRDPSASSSRGRGELVELPLFSDRPASSSATPPPMPSGSSSSMLPRLSPAPQHDYRQYWRPLWRARSPAGEGSSGSGGAMRVVTPPRRPQAGVWFMLKASQQQRKEPYLPQIAKSYLRIKDGGMTVRLVMKYLVSKLCTEDESEVEITCRGQQLLPELTLQHVREHIWRSPEAAAAQQPRDSPDAYDLMILDYGQSR